MVVESMVEGVVDHSMQWEKNVERRSLVRLGTTAVGKGSV